MMKMRLRLGRFSAVVVLAALATACDKPQSVGDANAIIAVMPDEAWSQLQPTTEDALEERAFSVRDERIFRVTQVDPASNDFHTLRQFRQLLVVGRVDDPWMEPTLNRLRQPIASLPAVVDARDVYAQHQIVTAIVLPEGADFAMAEPLMPGVGERLLNRFHIYAVQRMFASGADSVLADSLMRAHGFSVLLPQVYFGRQLEPRVFLFRNDHPDPSQLIRSILVTWRDAGEVDADGGTARAWREQAAQRFYDPAQVTSDELIVQPITQPGHSGVQIQGVWSNPPGEWPAAGPFITRVVECPAQNRTYLVDTWLYAPGRSKYEYMLQLMTLLNSFTCGTAPPPA
jgi:hypothetical protein